MRNNIYFMGYRITVTAHEISVFDVNKTCLVSMQSEVADGNPLWRMLKDAEEVDVLRKENDRLREELRECKQWQRNAVEAVKHSDSNRAGYVKAQRDKAIDEAADLRADLEKALKRAEGLKKSVEYRDQEIADLRKHGKRLEQQFERELSNADAVAVRNMDEVKFLRDLVTMMAGQE